MTWARPDRWPLVVRVPLLVAVLLVAVSVVVSQVVLARLAAEQQRRLAGLADAYLDGVSAALHAALVRRDVWEAFDVVDRARSSFQALPLIAAAALLPDGTVLAATDPRRLPVGSRYADADRVADDAPLAPLQAPRAIVARAVHDGGVFIGRVVIELDLSAELAARQRAGTALFLLNAILTVLFAALGWWLVRRMLAPVRLLSAHLAASGERPAPLPDTAIGRVGGEFKSLFARFNAMVRAVEEREALAARLAEEERLAVLGRLASGVAHEVNNPLGGMLTAVDTLASHGADPIVRAQSVGFLRRGLSDIRNVVRASLVLYKAAPAGSEATPEALDDLRHLAGPEARRRRVHLVWNNRLAAPVPADTTQVRQIALNLLLNAIAASPPEAEVRVGIEAVPGLLLVQVADQGPGLPSDIAAMLERADVPPPAGRTGLGLWTALLIAQRLGGRIRRLPTDRGTTLQLEVPVAERELAHAA
jgi:signal transduction histidine kinase